MKSFTLPYADPYPVYDHGRLAAPTLPAAETFYDPLRTIRHYVQQRTPHFGFFAETFLAPPDTMAYGNEPDHLDAIDADTTLGDLEAQPD